MKATLIAGVFIVVFLSAPSHGSAQFSSSLFYPDGSQSLNQNLGSGINASIFFDRAGDFDIFTHHTNAIGDFTTLSLEGFPAGIAYFLNFLGTVDTQLLFDVFVTTGGASRGLEPCGSSGGTFLFLAPGRGQSHERGRPGRRIRNTPSLP